MIRVAASDAPGAVKLFEEHDACKLVRKSLRAEAEEPARFCSKRGMMPEAASDAENDFGHSRTFPVANRLGPIGRRLGFARFIQKIKGASIGESIPKLRPHLVGFLGLDLEAGRGCFVRNRQGLKLELFGLCPGTEHFQIVVCRVPETRSLELAERKNREPQAAALVEAASAGPVKLGRDADLRSVHPKGLEVVVLAERIEEDVHDDVAAIHQDPAPFRVAFAR